MTSAAFACLNTHTHAECALLMMLCSVNVTQSQTLCSTLCLRLQATRPDMIRILSAALHVVLRRDMSLNRRLYAWLLGKNAHTQTHSDFMLYQSSQSPHDLWDVVETIDLDIGKHVEHYYINILKCGLESVVLCCSLSKPCIHLSLVAVVLYCGFQ